MITKRHFETEKQKGRRYFETITRLGGEITVRDDIRGILFDGPEEAPENSLFIPLSDFGYSEQHGIFRKSIRLEFESEINF